MKTQGGKETGPDGGGKMVAGHCGKQSEEKQKPPEALNGCMEQASNQAGSCRIRWDPDGEQRGWECSVFVLLMEYFTNMPETRSVSEKCLSCLAFWAPTFH